MFKKQNETKKIKGHLQLNSSELILMLQGWKIIQHGWNAKFAFRYSIPQFNQKRGSLWMAF